jgi:hypothetical protein
LAKNTGILAKVSLIVYPYLLSDYLQSASIGDNRDAFHAGYRSDAGNIGVICG